MHQNSLTGHTLVLDPLATDLFAAELGSVLGCYGYRQSHKHDKKHFVKSRLMHKRAVSDYKLFWKFFTCVESGIRG